MTPVTQSVKVLGSDEQLHSKTVDRRLLLFLYRTSAGRLLLRSLLIHSWFSDLYAWYYHSRPSARKIAAFVRAHAIDLSLFEEKVYRSFNDFFIRRFKPGQRQFTNEPAALPAFCEGFYSAFDSVSVYQSMRIKGQPYTLAGLFGDPGKAAPFINGPLIIARLAPYHYHWFHYLDGGNVIDSYHLPGKLHSVDPIATGQEPHILWTNKRDVTIVDTRNFGKIAYVEVGALTVGKIHQLKLNCAEVKRGDPKGYFSFGGSTVLVLGEKGRWLPLQELTAATANGQECAVLLGREIARKL